MNLKIYFIRKNCNFLWNGICVNRKNKKIRDIKNFIKFHHFILFFLITSFCQTYKEIQIVENRYDFYYGKYYFQILGKAKVENPYPTYKENLDLCIKEAKIYADSKWLGVTEKYIESQELWYDRLKHNYYSLWKKCLTEAKIVEVYPEFPNKCEIIVHYYCDPQKW